MVGDDLGDFVSISDTVRAGAAEPSRMFTRAERAALIDRFSGYWEDRWIVLPNPAYGSWERILYSQTASDAEQLAKQFSAVRGLPK